MYSQTIAPDQETEKKLAIVIQKLKQFEGATEDEFLKYGDLISKSNSNFKHIINLIRETIEIISSPAVLQNINSLRELTNLLNDKLSIIKKGATESQNSLKTISSNLIEVNNILADYNGFVKRLKMLGLSAKIESARISEMDSEFDNLAESVEKLSDRIDYKAKESRKKSGKLYQLIEAAANNTKNSSNKNNEIALSILEKSENSIKLLHEKFLLARKKSNIISKFTEQISEILGVVITSLQYQDISKQQIDHICEALNKTGEKRSNLDNGYFNDDELYSIYSVQLVQLQNTKKEFLSASKKLIEELKKIDSMTEKLDIMIVELLQSDDQTEDSYLNNTVKELKKIIDIVIGNSESEIKLVELIESLNETKKDLARFVDEVDEIGADIELIAMNSQIKAAGLGGDGASLGIIAEHIQKLSVNAKEQKTKLSSSFKLVDDETEVLSNLLLSSSENSKRLTDHSLVKTLNGVFESINNIQTKSLQNFKKINVSVNDLRRNILIQEELEKFYKYAEERFDDIIFTISKVTADFTSGLPFTKMSSSHLDTLKKNYTMQSERHVHDSLIKGNISSYQKSDFKNISKQGDSEFGDNVELF